MQYKGVILPTLCGVVSGPVTLVQYWTIEVLCTVRVEVLYTAGGCRCFLETSRRRETSSLSREATYKIRQLRQQQKSKMGWSAELEQRAGGSDG